MPYCKRLNMIKKMLITLTPPICRGVWNLPQKFDIYLIVIQFIYAAVLYNSVKEPCLWHPSSLLKCWRMTCYYWHTLSGWDLKPVPRKQKFDSKHFFRQQHFFREQHFFRQQYFSNSKSQCLECANYSNPFNSFENIWVIILARNKFAYYSYDRIN